MTYKDLIDNGFLPLTDKESALYNEYINDGAILDICYPVLTAYWEPLYRLKDGVMLVAVKEENDYIFLPPLGDLTKGTHQIFLINKEANVGYMVKEQADIFPKASSPDLRFSDYVVEKEQMTTLSWKYKHKLSDYNYFVKHYNYTLEDVNLTNANDCRTVLSSWCDGRDCSLCLFGCEKKVLESYLEAISKNQMYGLLAYCDNKPIGSLIACKAKDTLYYPYCKTDKAYTGLSVFMYIEFAKRFDVKYVNLGSDGGIEGIKHFKNKFKPYILKDKYFTT